MPAPATGHAIAYALGVEPGPFGVPGTTLVAYDPILPATLGVMGTVSEAQQINRSGFKRPGLPGPKGGNEVEFGHPWTAAHCLEFLQHLLGATTANGGVVKTTLESGVYRYVFTPQGVESFRHLAMFGLLAKPPVEYLWAWGIRWGSLEVEVTDEGEVPMRLSGLQQHGTLLGQADPAGGNTGTYTQGPWLRGLLADPTAGDVWVRVSRDVAGGGLQFKVEQIAAGPTFPGAAVDAVYVDGQGSWQNVQGADGLDLGVWAENKDPLEIVWPGDSTDHGDLDVGDTFQFPIAWTTPALTAIAGSHQRFTLAHFVVRARTIGAPAYTEYLGVRGVTLGISNEIEAQIGNASRYPSDLVRIGPLVPTITFTRDFDSRAFADKRDRHSQFDLQLAWLGSQLGTGANRESVTVTLPYAGDVEATSDVGEVGRVEEEVTVTGHTDDGAAPFTVAVITTRDWTPAV